MLTSDRYYRPSVRPLSEKSTNRLQWPIHCAHEFHFIRIIHLNRSCKCSGTLRHSMSCVLWQGNSTAEFIPLCRERFEEFLRLPQAALGLSIPNLASIYLISRETANIPNLWPHIKRSSIRSERKLKQLVHAITVRFVVLDYLNEHCIQCALSHV